MICLKFYKFFKMPWKLPPKIKIYEALGSIDDKRIFIS